MSRVITFSRYFPKGHPKAGEPTFFVEKIWTGLADQWYVMDDIDFSGIDFDFHLYYNGQPKWHTIRSGNRWKVGDKFSPRVWSGKPYASKQIVIAPDIEIKKIWQVHINFKQTSPVLILDGTPTFFDRGKEIAKNDGLSLEDFIGWFSKGEFHGQILSWSNDLKY